MVKKPLKIFLENIAPRRLQRVLKSTLPWYVKTILYFCLKLSYVCKTLVLNSKNRVSFEETCIVFESDNVFGETSKNKNGKGVQTPNT